MSDILTHAQIWTAIDALGERYGLTPSGLARKAGLDPTTFNRSKRETPSGRQRWPSTESIAKVLAATGAGLDEFMSLVTANSAAGRLLLPPRPQAYQPPGLNLPLDESAGAGHSIPWKRLRHQIPASNAYSPPFAAAASRSAFSLASRSSPVS